MAKDTGGPIILRQSIIFLIYRLFLIELVFIGSYLIFDLPLMFLMDTDPNTASIELGTDYYGLTLLLITSVIEMIIIIVVVLKWVNLYYEIREDEIIERHGIISVNENAHSFRNFAAISISQGIIGRIFNYGTLKLYNPAIDHSLTLRKIGSPQKYKNFLINKLPKMTDGLVVSHKK